MPISVVPYTHEYIDAAQGFNSRLRRWGLRKEYELPDSPAAVWLPKLPGTRTFNEIYLAVESGVVRGAYFLKHDRIWLGGSLHQVASFHHMLSEGIVNDAYATVGAQLVRHALHKQPLSYCLGLGGNDARLSKLLLQMDWSHWSVPFQFKILNARRFLEELPMLRSTRTCRLAANTLLCTGTGQFLSGIVQKLSTTAPLDPPQTGVASRFGDWSDEIWHEAKSCYSFLFERDTQTLNTLYGSNATHLFPITVRRGSTTLGWAVVGDLPNSGSKHYGNLRLGTILDTLSKPEHADAIVWCATKFLEERHVDLIVTNQMHPAWVAAVNKAGFHRGPSKCIFAVSKRLAELLSPVEKTIPSAHLNRSASDGLRLYSLSDNAPEQAAPVSWSKAQAAGR